MKRIALITGAAGSGIGARTAEALARRDYVVVATDIDDVGLRSTVDRLHGEGHRGIIYDVADKKAALQVFDEVERELGPVSVLVCSAGYIGTGQPELDEIKDEDWDRCFAVNVSGVFYAFANTSVDGRQNPFRMDVLLLFLHWLHTEEQHGLIMPPLKVPF